MKAWRALAGLAALPWVVTACATAGTQPWIVPPDARTADQQRQDTADCATVAAHASGYDEDTTMRNRALIGLFLGAAGGAGIGAAIGAGVGDTTTGTVVGAFFGGTIGAAIGGVHAQTAGTESYESLYHACLQARGYRIEERPATPAPMK